MGIKAYKPTTNGRRNMTSLDFAEITTSTPEKSLLVSLKNYARQKLHNISFLIDPLLFCFQDFV